MNINPQFFKDIILETQDNQSRLSISSNDIYDIENKDLDRRIKNVGLNEISIDLNKLNIQNEALNIGSTRAFIAYDQFDIPVNIESPIFLTNSQNNKIDMKISSDGTPWILKNINQANNSTEMQFDEMLSITFEDSKKRIDEINDELESKYINKEFTISDGNSLYSLLGISVLSVSDIISGYNLIGLENGDISVTGYTAVEAIYQNLLNTKSLIEELKTIDQSEEYYKFQIDRIRSITGKTDLDELILTLDKYLEDLSKITAPYNQLIEERSRLVSMLYDKKMYDLVKPFETVINNEDFEKYSKMQLEEGYIVLSEEELKEYYEYKEKYPYIFADDTIKNGNQIHVSFLETLKFSQETLHINAPLLLELHDLYFYESNKEDLKYLNDTQKNIYYYHYNKNGTSTASSYLKALTDYINRAKGFESFTKYRDFMLSDAGEVTKFLESFLKGLLDGFDGSIENFISAFFSDGKKSPNQYEQMFILEFLATNYTKEGLEQYKKALEENQISQQDYDNYYKTYTIVNSSNEMQWIRTVFYKGAYQVGSGIGYMAPSIGLNLAMPGLGTGYLFVSSFGGKLEQSHQTYGTLTSDAYVYSFMSALAATALEKLGGLPGFSDENVAILKKLFNEAWTELIQEYIDNGFDSIHYKQKYDIKDVSLSAIEQAIFGFITAGVLSGGTVLAQNTPMIINVAGQEIKLSIQQLLNLYEAYKITDIDLRNKAIMELSGPLGIIYAQPIATSPIITDEQRNKLKPLYPDGIVMEKPYSDIRFNAVSLKIEDLILIVKDFNLAENLLKNNQTDFAEGNYYTVLNALANLKNNLFVNGIIFDIFTEAEKTMLDSLEQKYYKLIKELRQEIELKTKLFLEKPINEFVINGIKFKVHTDLDTSIQPVTQTDIENILNEMPDILKGTIKQIDLFCANNPIDSFLRIAYGSDFVSTGMGGDGKVSIFPPKSENFYDSAKQNWLKQLFYHESGHNIDENCKYSRSIEWIDAMSSDNNYPSDYSKKSNTEDFAESVYFFFQDRSSFETKFPNRAKILIKILGL